MAALYILNMDSCEEVKARPDTVLFIIRLLYLIILKANKATVVILKLQQGLITGFVSYFYKKRQSSYSANKCIETL